MAKFSPSEAKRSLIEGISLLTKTDEYVWAEYPEINDLYTQGYVLVNDLKQEFFEKQRKVLVNLKRQ